MRKKGLVLLVIISLFALTGCWDLREPEDLAIVLLGAYDYNPETDMFKIIFQIESPQSVQDNGQSGGGGGTPPYWIVSAWGYTPIDAVNNIRKKVSRRINYSHLHLLVISETTAREKGIVTVMDTLARSRQSRPIINIAVTKDDVEKVLSSNMPIETTVGQGLLNLIHISEEELGITIIQNGRQFLNKMSTPGIEPVATNLVLLEEEKESELKGDTPPPLKLGGFAAFRNDKMVGVLKDREARGWNWLYGKKKIGAINFTYPENEDIKVTVLTKSDSHKIIPEIKNNEPIINIKMDVRGRLESFTGLSQLKKQSELIVSMENRLAEAVRNDIREGVKKAKKLNSDIFGFGNVFYRLKYDRWKRMEDRWDSLFPELPVIIDVNATIEKSGLVNKGIKLQ